MAGSRLRPDLVSFSADRTFWEAEVEGGTPAGRATPAPPHAAALNAYLRERGLRVPAFHGTVEAGGWRAALWEYRRGRSEAGFAHYGAGDLDGLMRAVALLSARSVDASAHLPLPTGPLWAEPAAAAVRELAGGEPVVAALAPQIDTLEGIEEELIAALGAAGPAGLTHNDLKPSNVVLGDDGEVWIVDWDSASIGPPGASLRTFAELGGELERTAAARYAHHMASLGVPVAADDVRFVMRAQQLLWSVVTGLRRGHLRRILAGLWLVDQVAEDLGHRGAPRPAPEELKRAVRRFMEKNRGRLYSPIPHPDFAGWPSSRGTERFDTIGPHLDHRGGTALDIGTHFGTFAHWLEDLGYQVTAVEKSGRYAAIARQVRDLTGKRFELVTGSVFDLEHTEYDVVFALNIFHHFLKTEETFRALEAFLGRLRCRTMIFQAHVAAEGQMAGAHRNFEQEEFARWVAERAGLGRVEEIGQEGPRRIFKLSEPAATGRDRVGREDIYLVPAQSYERQRERGFIARRDSEPWPLALPLDWAADPFGDPNWCSKLAHWRMTDPILTRYFETGDRALLREAFAYALDWHRFHVAEGREASFAWRDGPAGIRALRVAFFLDRVRSGELEVTDAELAALHELVDEHARRLQDPGFVATTNHGLFQVFGLRLLAEVAPDRPACAEAAEFAAARFREVLHAQFDRHGVHREHSPAYHFFVTRLIASLGGTRHFPDPEIEALLARAGRTEAWLVHPDGHEPPVGDSGGTHHATAPPEEPVVALADGRRHLVGDLTASGYAIVRSAPPEQESMLFVTGAAHSGTHKHADDLSFELFERGRRVLVDGGKYGYFRRDHKRAYVKGASAHSTIALADRRVGPLDVAMTGSSLRSLRTTVDGRFEVRGEVERPDLFRQHRTILYDPGRFLVVADRLSAAEARAYVSSLLLAPDLVPELDGVGFAIRADDGLALGGALVLPDGGPGTVEAVRGQDDPLLGWVSPAYGQLEPATVLRAHCPGTERRIAWALWFGDDWRDEAMRRAAETGMIER